MGMPSDVTMKLVEGPTKLMFDCMMLELTEFVGKSHFPFITANHLCKAQYCSILGLIP